MQDKRAARRLLVAEDDPVCQTMIRCQLQVLGYDVDVVDNGSEALTALADQRYDLVLMDCQMPVLDGYEATRCLRREGNRLPVIAFTAQALRRVRDECLDAGMDDALGKPAGPQELKDLLDAWLPAVGDSASAPLPQRVSEPRLAARS